jgi:hypothetical protein
MGRPMQWLRVLGFAFVTGSLAAGCAHGKDVKSAGKEDKLAFDEEGKGRKCENPKSSCEEVTDPSLDFKEKCREAGYRMKQCGCDNLCTGNIKGDRTGYNSKNQMKTCKDSGEKCETQETSAAYQDACDMTGGEMMECGCEWLCSKKLKEAIPDAPKEEEKKDVSGDDATKKEEKAKDDKPHGSMDGRSADEIAKDKAAKDKAAKDKAASDKAAKDQAAKDKAAKPSKSKGDKSDKSDSGEPKKSGGRFKLPD